MLLAQMEFQLSENQLHRFRVWKAQFDSRNFGAIGGLFTFEFTPTTIGTIIKVRFQCGTEHAVLDLTDDM